MPSSTLQRSQWGDLFLLACCQAVGQAGNIAMFAATALSVSTFHPSKDLATLPITMQHVGVMLAVFPAAILMQRHGRKLGFLVGSIAGMLGALLMATGLNAASLPVMSLGGLVLGYAVASLQMYRFAAIELVLPSESAKAISWVTAGGVVAAIIGPLLVRWTHEQLVPTYVGTYLGMIGLHLTVMTIMTFIRFPKPSAGAPAAGAAPAKPTLPARPLSEIAAQPRFIVAVIGGMSAFGTMSLIMSAAPLAIVACGLPHTEAHWVILMHVMGMFVPSFFTGNLIKRFGELPVMAAGVATLLLGIAVAVAGLSEWHFRIALTLNGVGWNFLFVGSTALVTTTYRQSERGKVQALNDFLVFGTTASSSFLAGIMQQRLGWAPLNTYSVALVGAALLATIWLWRRNVRVA